MSNEALTWMMLGSMFAGPLLAALTYAWVMRRRQARLPAPPRRKWHASWRRPSTLWDLKCMAEFQRRWRRCAKWTWVSWALAAVALFALGLPMTALALALLVPLATWIEHLRCPYCGYDIRGLPVDPSDGATVCPECGCAWRVPVRYY